MSETLKAISYTIRREILEFLKAERKNNSMFEDVLV